VRSVDRLGVGANAAMGAAVNGHAHVMRMMIDAGVPIDQVDAEGRNLMHYACMATCNAADVTWAVIQEEGGGVLIEQTDDNGNTVLHVAASLASVEMVTAITKQFNHMVTLVNKRGQTALHSVALCTSEWPKDILSDENIEAVVSVLAESNAALLNG
jgi:hypothetical protein